jgi:hypothetical protein
MSLLPEDPDHDVEFELHESYGHDADMGFPSDFGTEEIAAELSVPHDAQAQNILSVGVDISDDHHNYQVPLHHQPLHGVVKSELSTYPASDLLIQSEDGGGGGGGDADDQSHDIAQDEECSEEQVEEKHVVEQDEEQVLQEEEDEVADEEEQDDVYPNPDHHNHRPQQEHQQHHLQQEQQLHESEDCDMEEDAPDFADGDEDFEKNLLEPEVDLIEEEQPVDTKPAFHAKGSAQPNVVRRFSRTTRPPANSSSFTHTYSSGDEDGDDEDYDCPPIRNDDRRGCRSLVCDANSIIIAEMVYRCLICAHVTESIGDAQRHYHKKHMTKDRCKKGPKKPPSNQMNGHTFENFSEQDVDELENEAADFSGEDVSSQPGHTSQSTVTFDVPSSLRQLQQTLTPESKGMTGETLTTTTTTTMTTKKPGNFVYSPSPADYVPGRNANKALSSASSQSNSNAARGGYVTCAVCNITKYYASVQRRYGQFTCMGCAKFFGRFLIKPRRYFCPNLGSCPLDVSPRCKACLLLACISTYNIDEKRMKIVNANRPLKKTGQPAPAPRPQVLTSINQQQNSSLTFAPPPLVKVPAGQRGNQITRPPPPPPPPPAQSQLMDNDDEEEDEDELAAEQQMANVSGVRQQPQRSAGMRTPVRSPVLSSSRSVNGSGHFSSSASAALAASGRKGTGCRQCANCLSDDCGKCNYCLDKPKFGGPNTLKKKCIQKKCLLIQPNSNQRIRMIRK